MPKYLADVHISPLTVSDLRQAGYDIIRVTDFLPATASDEEIVSLAIDEEAVIITQDLDFSALVAQSPLAKPSVLSLRLNNAKPHIVSGILKQLLPRIETELAAGVIVSVDESHFRIRKLPVTQ